MRGPLVEAWFGFPGAGKTFAMTAAALRAKRREPGLRVYSNYPIRFEDGSLAIPVESLEDFESAQDGLLLLDEAHIALDSRQSTGSGRSRWVAKLGQLRKSALFLWYTTHDPSKVDKQLRNLTEQSHWMLSARRLGFFLSRVRVGAAPSGASLGIEIVRFNGAAHGAYDTFWHVGVSGLAGLATKSEDGAGQA